MTALSLEKLRKNIIKAIDEKQFDKALNLLSSLSEQHPDFCLDNFQYFMALADSYMGLNQFLLARENYLKVLESDPEQLSINLELIKCEIAMDNFDLALTKIATCLKLAEAADPELIKYLYIQQAEIALRLNDMQQVYTCLQNAADNGAMDIDVMDNHFIYDAMIDDEKFEAIFED